MTAPPSPRRHLTAPLGVILCVVAVIKPILPCLPGHPPPHKSSAHLPRLQAPDYIDAAWNCETRWSATRRQPIWLKAASFSWFCAERLIYLPTPFIDLLSAGPGWGGGVDRLPHQRGNQWTHSPNGFHEGPRHNNCATVVCCWCRRRLSPLRFNDMDGRFFCFRCYILLPVIAI